MNSRVFIINPTSIKNYQNHLTFQDFEKRGAIFQKFVNLMMAFKEKYQASDSVVTKWVKTYLNHAYGKLSMKPFTQTSTFCTDYHELSRIVTTQNVVDIIPLSPELIDVICIVEPSNGRNPYSSVPLGVHIPSYARMLLQEKIHEIKSIFNDPKIHLVNTDSCVVEIGKDEVISRLPISGQIGHWKHEIKDAKDILRFLCLNPVAFHITYIANDDEVRQVTKLAGFKLKNALAPGIEADQFKYLLESAQFGSKATIVVPQIRRMIDSEHNITGKKMLFYLRNSFDSKRVNCPDLSTCAYGYIE